MVLQFQYNLQCPHVHALLVDRYFTFNFFLIVIFGSLVHKITERHQLLEETVSAREDETEAYNRVQYLNNCLTPIFLTALFLEAASFYFYTNTVTY